MKKIAFLFPGQGSQAVGMGKDLFEEFVVVRELFDMAEEIVRLNLRKLCFQGPMEELTLTINLQPAITVINLALYSIIAQEGIRPHMAAGHSLGEYSALHAAGIIAAPDTCQLVMKRGQLMHREATAHQGAMHAIIGLTIDALTPLVAEARETGIVSVANHNSLSQIVITGEPGAVHQASTLAKAQGAKVIPLKVSGAWHSDLIKGAEEDFRSFIDPIEFATPQVPVIHNATADVAQQPEAIKDVMVQQLCHPVKWYDTMERLVTEEVEVFVEVGPGKVLSGLARKHLAKSYPASIFAVNSIATLEKFLNTMA